MAVLSNADVVRFLKRSEHWYADGQTRAATIEGRHIAARRQTSKKRRRRLARPFSFLLLLDRKCKQLATVREQIHEPIVRPQTSRLPHGRRVPGLREFGFYSRSTAPKTRWGRVLNAVLSSATRSRYTEGAAEIKRKDTGRENE